MWINHILLSLFGFASGIAIAAGTFAFIIMIGIIPRVIGRSHTGEHILCYENAVLLGGIIGNIV